MKEGMGFGVDQRRIEIRTQTLREKTHLRPTAVYPRHRVGRNWVIVAACSGHCPIGTRPQWGRPPMYPRDLVNSPWLMLLIVDLVHAPVKEDHGGTANSTLRAHHRALSRSHSTVACAPIDGRVRRQGCSQWRHLFLPRARPPCSSSTGAFKTHVVRKTRGNEWGRKLWG
jgi:hypothetical protein